MIVESRQIAGDYLSASARTSIPSSICASIRDDSRYPGAMGSLRALVLLASLAACDTSGLEIVVLPPDEGGMVPDKVRLFIGTPAEGTGGIAPEGFAVTEKRYGNIWDRDPMNRGDMLAWSGDAISFGFLAESDHTELGAIVAVGYNDDVPTSAGSLFHLKTGVGNVRVYELQLHPAVDPRKRENRTELLQVEVWGEDVGSESCLHLANKRPDRDMDHEHHNIFIVADGDRDCDGYADEGDALECRAEVHDAMMRPEVSDLSCALVTPTPVGGGAFCVLGGPRCVDGRNQDPAECTPSRFCAPPSVCNVCGSRPAAEQLDCIHDPFAYGASPGEMFGIVCHVPSTVDPDTSNKRLCGIPVGLPAPVPSMTSMPQCANGTISTPASSPQDRLEVGTMRFDVDVSSACDFKLTASGAIPADFNFTRISGLVTADIETGRSIALPIQILIDEPTSACGTTGSCSLAGEPADRPTQCLLAPPDSL